MSTTTKSKPRDKRAIVHIEPGKRVPIINPPVAPPPTKAEVVKAMVQLYREQAADALVKAKHAHVRAGEVLNKYREMIHAKPCIPKPDPKALSAMMPGREFDTAHLETCDKTEKDGERYEKKQIGHLRWSVTFTRIRCDEYDSSSTATFPWFAAPEPVASEWKALRADFDRARVALTEAEKACEPPAVAAARRAIEGTAMGPQRARCEAILADEESRKVLSRALAAALRPKDVAGRPLVDADAVVA